MTKDELIADLTPFVDIGAVAPTVSEKDGKLTAKLVRDNRTLKVVVDLSTGKAHFTPEGGQTRYCAGMAQLLAHDAFANLRRWSDSQASYLKLHAVPEKDLIPIRGRTHDGTEILSTAKVNECIGVARPAADAAEILLIDGPAGIGKSTLIEQIALERAVAYRTTANPLILHVKSRGRVLSNLQDLMAFSLQTLRLHITYDQVPVLVKNGLIVLAIDGFDELGDPSGYELAWAQINDLVTAIRGNGSLILAGRDTFIGRDRLLKDVRALRASIDIVSEIALDSPTPAQAKEWLKRKAQWSDSSFELPAVSVLLESNSYALRPVFLRLLRDEIRPKEIKAKSETDLTTLLVNHMVKRESTKFGDVVEKVMTLPGIEKFVHTFLREIAREMAESQTESVDTNALIWIAEAALGDGWSPDVATLVKHRVNVIAFLCDDERAGHRRFSHAQIMNYFLSHVTLETVSSGEIPKYIRRNLLGKEFLSSFSEVIFERSAAGDESVHKFLFEASKFVTNYGHMDRAVRNTGALLLSSLPAFEEGDLTIGGFHVDEATLRRTAPRSVLKNMVINQLDVRGADLSAIEFSSVAIVRLIADDLTKLSSSFPDVTSIQLGDGETLTGDSAISKWLDHRGRKDIGATNSGVPQALKVHPVYRLLGRACRQRQYWLRSEGDFHAAKILEDEWWPMLSEVLRNHGFLREEVDRQAAGKSSTFYHIRQPDRLLVEGSNEQDVELVFRELTQKIKSA